ncbi:response regulator transcription factor [Streptomyces sp. 2A115]|uniref:response regulator transcription factor n=1 Tax=Streptomyces sp. 2A115 TaxID=3457439 RepID=UPI003FD3468C
MRPADGQLLGSVVYIVDDDQELCRSLAWLLESVKIRSLCFTDVRTFLDSYDHGQPACMVLDVRMPQVGGFQLQEILNRAGSAIPVIFVSAHGDIRMSVRALQNGAVDFLEKPYDPQHMLDVVQQALRTAQDRFARAARQQALQTRLGSLSPREREILRLVIDGIPSKNIATRLGISTKTVDVHRTHIREKTRAESMATLVRDVLQTGLSHCCWSGPSTSSTTHPAAPVPAGPAQRTTSSRPGKGFRNAWNSPH